MPVSHQHKGVWARDQGWVESDKAVSCLNGLSSSSSKCSGHPGALPSCRHHQGESARCLPRLLQASQSLHAAFAETQGEQTVLGLLASLWEHKLCVATTSTRFTCGHASLSLNMWQINAHTTKMQGWESERGTRLPSGGPEMQIFLLRPHTFWKKSQGQEMGKTDHVYKTSSEPTLHCRVRVFTRQKNRQFFFFCDHRKSCTASVALTPPSESLSRNLLNRGVHNHFL